MLKETILYNTLMTKLVKYKILRYLNFLDSIGYKYHKSFDFISNDINSASLPNDLHNLKSTVDNCYLCEFSKTRKKAVFGEGNPNAKIMFIGETPTSIEDETGKIFVGRSGELLTKMIENVLKIKRESVYISNIIKCKPSNSKSTFKSEANLCKSYLFKEIELVKPDIIVTLGQEAYTYLTDEEQNLSMVRGQTINYRNMILVPTFHPSFLLRNPSSKKEAYVDMLKIKNLLESGN